jgi:hypothetical protein
LLTLRASRVPIRVLILLLCLCAGSVSAGDAIAIGYNYDGVWTALTYNRSSTPKGGAHYRAATEACIFALRDLHSRANDYVARTKIIGQSDATGYVTVARGRASNPDKDVTAIGRGKSQTEADANALQKLSDTQASANQEIVYRYFSYGVDSAPPRPKHTKRKRPTHRSLLTSL